MYLVLTGILAVSGAIAWRSLAVAHARGDQSFYVALAMKLDTGGLADYSLRYVDVDFADGFSSYRRGTNTVGDLLAAQRKKGVTFYDAPLFHTPPLFPYALVATHRWLAADEPYQLLAVPKIAERRLTPEAIALRQLDSCLVPLVFGLILILVTYWLGSCLTNRVIGLGAAAVVAFSPAVLLSSQRVWADTLLAALSGMAVLLAYHHRQRPHCLWWMLSAVALGLALLTKITAILTVVPVLVCLVAGGNPVANWRTRLKELVGYAVIVGLITVPWYVAVDRAFGTPFYAPQQPGIATANSWFAGLQRLPWYTYLAGLPYQVPLFAMGYVGVLSLVRRTTWRTETGLLGVWFGIHLVALTIITKSDPTLGPEQRYLLPAYPALAVLSVAGLNNVHTWLKARLGRGAAHLIAGLIAVTSLAWTGVVAYRTLSMDDVPLPF